MVDTSKLKPGDVVHVRAIFQTSRTATGRPQLIVGAGNNSCCVIVERGDIVHVEPRPLKVGDIVTWGQRVWNYEILFVDGDVAFLRATNPGQVQHSFQPLQFLERADA